MQANRRKTLEKMISQANGLYYQRGQGVVHTKEFGPSSSGKTIIIATTEGNVPIPGREEIKVGLNVYKKPERQKVKEAGEINLNVPGKITVFKVNKECDLRQILSL